MTEPYELCYALVMFLLADNKRSKYIQRSTYKILQGSIDTHEIMDLIAKKDVYRNVQITERFRERKF